jgi:hypothetical protein
MKQAADALEFVDIRAAVAAIDRAYLEHSPWRDDAQPRIRALAWAAADERLYVVVGSGWVFWSRDDGRGWQEVREVNRASDGTLRAPGSVHVDAIVDSVRGTVVLLGRDGAERGAVWRKPIGASRFERIDVAGSTWKPGKLGNAAAGYVGHPPQAIVAMAVYDSPARFWYSLDDGLSWREQSLEGTFALHVHEVYAPRAVNEQRRARLWVSGGDDPSGRASGVVTFDRVDANGTLGGLGFALRERPGYRLVGLAGDGKHVYVGNESLCGGVLRILDNAESIASGDFEYVLGKGRHDYHQFRSLVATADGFLASATDSYAFIGDSIRADSGGYLYVSADGGASYCERSLAMKWVTALAYDGKAFWVAGGMSGDSDSDPSTFRLTLLRVPKPGAWDRLGSDYCAKALVVDSSEFYAMAGYPEHPRPRLEPAERTFRTDLSPYPSIVVEAESHGPGKLVVETLTFENWTVNQNAWRDVATLDFERAGCHVQSVPASGALGRWFRVRNDGAAPIELRRVVLIGKR